MNIHDVMFDAERTIDQLYIDYPFKHALELLILNLKSDLTMDAPYRDDLNHLDGAIYFLSCAGMLNDDQEEALHLVCNQFEKLLMDREEEIEEDKYLAMMERDRKIVAMWNEGRTLKEIARETGLSATRARQVYREMIRTYIRERKEKKEKFYLERRAKRNG